MGELAPGRTFADVGCMWSIHGRIAFLAEEAGATEVTGFDAMEPTPEFEREHATRGSSVRFVRGDLHDPASVEAIGAHDVVWCNGVVYHSPAPLVLVERLCAITRETLVLGSHTIPEVPGRRQACVLYPGLDERERAVFANAFKSDDMPGVTRPFAPDEGHANWYWGITPSALAGMVRACGLRVERLIELEPFVTTVVASRRHLGSAHE